jgi:hypothetical protein
LNAKEEEFVEVAKSLENFNSMDSLMKFLDSIKKTYKATPTNNIEAQTESSMKDNVVATKKNKLSAIENTLPLVKKPASYEEIKLTKNDLVLMKNVLFAVEDVCAFVEAYSKNKSEVDKKLCEQNLFLFLDGRQDKMYFLDKLMVKDMIDFQENTEKGIFLNTNSMSEELINKYIANLDIFESEGEGLKQLITANYNLSEKPYIVQLLINDFNKFASSYMYDVQKTVKNELSENSLLIKIDDIDPKLDSAEEIPTTLKELPVSKTFRARQLKKKVVIIQYDWLIFSLKR